jgi:hypothetical protein
MKIVLDVFAFIGVGTVLYFIVGVISDVVRFSQIRPPLVSLGNELGPASWAQLDGQINPALLNESRLIAEFPEVVEVEKRWDFGGEVNHPHISGVCHVCGCTDLAPCVTQELLVDRDGPLVLAACSWFDDAHTLCSNVDCVRVVLLCRILDLDAPAAKTTQN